MEVKDIWWPQCCYMDNDNLQRDNLAASRCKNPAVWKIEGENEPYVDSCDVHLSILLEEGKNTVTKIIGKGV